MKERFNIEKIEKILHGNYIKHILLFLFIVVIVESLSFHYFESKFERYMGKSVDVLQSKEVIVDLNHIKNKNYQIRFKGYLQDIKIKINYHIELTKTLYTKYYKSIIIFIIMTILASICLSVITKEGMTNVNRYFITMFLAFSSLSVYFGSFSIAFEHEENIKRNIEAIKVHENLQNRLVSTIVTFDDQNFDASKYFQEMDENINKAFTLFVSFNKGATVEYLSNNQITLDK